MAELSYEEELRYNRQIILKAVDFDGQEKLKDSRMLIVGLGGLGCAASQYLAAAGVGHLTLLDFDTVSLSNLQRQVLHTDSRLNMPKVESAKIALQQINPHVEIETINAQLSEEKLAITGNNNRIHLMGLCCLQQPVKKSLMFSFAAFTVEVLAEMPV